MVVLGAIELNEHYRILDAELSEGYVDLFLRLHTWGTSIHVSLPNSGYPPDIAEAHIGSYFVYEGMDESRVPHIHFMRGDEWRNKVRFITRYPLWM